MEKHADADKKALGQRLAAVREQKGWKQEFVAGELGVKKATVSAWETGRNMPDALFLKRLAKLYGIGVDAILWENALSTEAMMVAAQFDSLNERQRKTFHTLVMAFITEAASDERVAAAFQQAQDDERARHPSSANELLVKHPLRRETDDAQRNALLNPLGSPPQGKAEKP